MPAYGDKLKYTENDEACFYAGESVFATISNFCKLIKKNTLVTEPFRGNSDELKTIFLSENFVLYPTVKKTTLFYDTTADCFLKVLHPVTIKNIVLFNLMDKARHIYTYSECLLSKNIKVPKVLAYGKIRKGGHPFFVMEKLKGSSLYDIIIRNGETLTIDIYFSVIAKLAELHTQGYWLGDAHLSHIFVKDAEVSGFIDIDSIRKNLPFRLNHIAKDLAGLNHPKLPLTEDEKEALLKFYMDKAAIKEKGKFLRLLKHYAERRWKG